MLLYAIAGEPRWSVQGCRYGGGVWVLGWGSGASRSWTARSRWRATPVNGRLGVLGRHLRRGLSGVQAVSQVGGFIEPRWPPVPKSKT
jgi:hypothetical protein